VALVKLREIKNKIERRTSAKDRSNNVVSTKDIVRVVEGPLKVKLSSAVDFHIIRSSDNMQSLPQQLCLFVDNLFSLKAGQARSGGAHPQGDIVHT
jgi:hypothetical protein